MRALEWNVSWSIPETQTQVHYCAMKPRGINKSSPLESFVLILHMWQIKLNTLGLLEQNLKNKKGIIEGCPVLHLKLRAYNFEK